MKNKGISLIAIIIIVVVLIVLVAIGAVLINKKSQKNDNNDWSNNPTTASEKNNTSKNELVYNDTKNFDYTDVDGGIAITLFHNYDYIEYDKIIIPATIDGKTVVGIGEKNKTGHVMSAVFGNCEVVIPKSVTYIAKEAFRGSKGLVKLSGGENVSEIYEEAFGLCENLKEITFIDKVKYIDDSAFSTCPNFNYKFETKIIDKNQMLNLNTLVCKNTNEIHNEKFTIDFNQKASTVNDNYYGLNVENDEEKDIITRLEFDLEAYKSFYINDIELVDVGIIELKEKLGEPYAELVSSSYDGYFKSYFYKRRYVYRFNDGYILLHTNLSGTTGVEIIRNEYTNLDSTLHDFING